MEKIEQNDTQNLKNDGTRVDAERLAKLLAQVIDNRKGERIEVLDLRELTVWSDFFVIASSAVRIQVQSMVDDLIREAKENGYKKSTAEGLQESDWILVDFADVVVHLMTHESREFYRLEKLWGDAPRIRWNTETNETEKE